MNKLLTKKQKQAEAKRQLKSEVKYIQEQLLKKLEKSFHSGAIPEYFYEEGNHLLTKAIIDSFCRDRPYSPISSFKKDIENIHNFI